MNSRPLASSTLVVIVLFSTVLVTRTHRAFGQSLSLTNGLSGGSGGTNILRHTPVLTGRQRMLYYAATHTNHNPTSTQLNAITLQDVGQLETSALLTNGVWRIVTSQTNIPLNSLTGIYSKMPVSNALSTLSASISNAPPTPPSP